MNKTLDDFFTENDVRIGKDFTTTPPIYYQSLIEGMHGYFNSILKLKFKYNTLLQLDIQNRESIAFNFNDNDSTVSCILGLHRFFELLLKDLLARVDPFFAVKFLENEKQHVAYLNKSLDPETVNTIEFSDAFKRFRALLNPKKENIENLNVAAIERFDFLIKDDSLAILSKWRNRIIHNGKTLPNIFALDFLVTQKILPLIFNVLENDKDVLNTYYPHCFITPSGINVLEKLLSDEIKFDYLDFDKKSPEEVRDLIRKLFKIGHLKELARGTFYFDRYLTQSNISFHETYYENPKGRLERFAKAEQENECYYETQVCLSCGIDSLIVYKKEVEDLRQQKLDYYYCSCTSCDYFFSENFADPFILGLSDHRIFPQH